MALLILSTGDSVNFIACGYKAIVEFCGYKAIVEF